MPNSNQPAGASPTADPGPANSTSRAFAIWGRRFWIEIASTPDLRHRRLLAATALVLVAVIGTVDYLTGVEISLLPFYFLPICLATAAFGWTFGVVTASASVATWILSDFAAGARYANPLVVGWNALVAFAVYLVVVWLLSSLLAAQRETEERVRQRTAALTHEIAERERLERAVLEIAERERRAIGRDLHDGLGQHLTGTALVAQAHSARLAARRAEEADDAKKIVALVEEGIEQTKDLAKGLLVEIEREGLAEALGGLATVTSQRFRIACTFRGEAAVAFDDAGAATHLYRIAQESVGNAVRHGRAKRIDIELSDRDGALVLNVRDDGLGLPSPDARGRGLGLQIMAHRAEIIGASFRVASQPDGGTLVACRLSHPDPGA